MTNIQQVATELNTADGYLRSTMVETSDNAWRAKKIMETDASHPAVTRVTEAIAALFSHLRGPAAAVEQSVAAALADEARTGYQMTLGEEHPLVGISHKALGAAETTIEYGAQAHETIDRGEQQLTGMLQLVLESARIQGQRMLDGAEETTARLDATRVASAETIQRIIGGAQA